MGAVNVLFFLNAANGEFHGGEKYFRGTLQGAQQA